MAQGGKLTEKQQKIAEKIRCVLDVACAVSELAWALFAWFWLGMRQQ